MALGSGSGGGKDYVDGRNAQAVTSFVSEKIYGRGFEAPRALLGPCPPEGAPVVPLTEQEKLMFITWIDTGATFK